MATEQLLKELKLKIEPARKELHSRLCTWSGGLIEEQVLDGSLFWKLPSQVIRNLQRVLGSNYERRLDFFRTRHRGRYRAVLREDLPPFFGRETTELMSRCTGPSEKDIHELGLIPNQLASKINRRRLLHLIGQAIGGPNFEFSAPGEYQQNLSCGPWTIQTNLLLRGIFQLELEHDVRIGSEGPSIKTGNISLHSVLGVFTTGWDLALPGDEEKVARQAGEYYRFVTMALAEMLSGIDPGVSDREVAEAVTQWQQWLDERGSTADARRVAQSRRSSDSEDD